jgi:hypothetical protein
MTQLQEAPDSYSPLRKAPLAAPPAKMAGT